MIGSRLPSLKVAWTGGALACVWWGEGSFCYLRLLFWWGGGIVGGMELTYGSGWPRRWRLGESEFYLQTVLSGRQALGYGVFRDGGLRVAYFPVGDGFGGWSRPAGLKRAKAWCESQSLEGLNALAYAQSVREDFYGW